MKYLMLIIDKIKILFFSIAPTKTMNMVSQDWANWVNGKKFAFHYVTKIIDDTETIDVVLSVGARPVVIDRLVLKGTISDVTLQWSYGAEIDRTMPSAVPEIPLNINVQSTSGAIIYINPTITGGAWTNITNPVVYVGLLGYNNSSRMHEELITEKITFAANTNHRLSFDSTDARDPTIELLFTLFVL